MNLFKNFFNFFPTERVGKRSSAIRALILKEDQEEQNLLIKIVINSTKKTLLGFLSFTINIVRLEATVLYHQLFCCTGIILIYHIGYYIYIRNTAFTVLCK